MMLNGLWKFAHSMMKTLVVNVRALLSDIVKNVRQEIAAVYL